MKKEYLIYKLSEDLKEATRIENELFRKFDEIGRASCRERV